MHEWTIHMDIAEVESIIGRRWSDWTEGERVAFVRERGCEIETGIAEIDSQHRQILRVAADLEASSQLGKVRPNADELLDTLIGYAQEHFSLEERMMRESSFPGLEAHRSEHAQALGDLLKLSMAAHSTGPAKDVGEEAGRFVTAWVKNHVLQTDLLFASHWRRR